MKEEPYFGTEEISEIESGSLSLRPIHPYIISGGEVTERWYFDHLKNCSKYKFRIKPDFFGNESLYIEKFQKYINEILSGSPDAKIYCVFDWDTIYDNSTCQEKHKIFEQNLSEKISNGSVVLCPSMPCIEYWFLLHFVNEVSLFRKCGSVVKILNQYMRSYFPDQKPSKDSKREMINVPYLRKVKLGHILKNADYLENIEWVKKLCEDGKLETAIERAKENIKNAQISGSLNSQSYSFVFLPFLNYDADTSVSGV